MGRERAFDRLLARRLACARDELLRIVGLLEHAVAEQRHARRPGRAVLGRALGPELGAERDQLAHVRDGLDRSRRREPDEPLRVEVVAEQEDRVAVAGREEPRPPVVDEVPLVDRLDARSRSAPSASGEKTGSRSRAPRGPQRIAPERALALGVERDLLPQVSLLRRSQRRPPPSGRSPRRRARARRTWPRTATAAT